MNSAYSNIYNNGSPTPVGMGTWNTHPKLLSQSLSMPKLGMSTQLPGCITKPYYNPGSTSKPMISPELLKMQLLEYKLNDLEKKKTAQAEELNNLLASQMMAPPQYIPVQPYPPSYYQQMQMPPDQYLEYVKSEERKKGIKEGMRKAIKKLRRLKRDEYELDENDCYAIDSYYANKRRKRENMLLRRRERYDSDDEYNKNRSCDNRTNYMKPEMIEKIIKDNLAKIEQKQQEEFKNLRASLEKDKQKEMEYKMQQQLREKEKELENERKKILNEMQKKENDNGVTKRIRASLKNIFAEEKIPISSKDEDLPDYIENLPKLIDHKIKESEKKKEEELNKEERLKKKIEEAMHKKFSEILLAKKNPTQHVNNPPLTPTTNIAPVHQVVPAQVVKLPPIKIEPTPQKKPAININDIIREKLKEHEIREQLKMENRRKEQEIKYLMARESKLRQLEELEKNRMNAKLLELEKKDKEEKKEPEKKEEPKEENIQNDNKSETKSKKSKKSKNAKEEGDLPDKASEKKSTKSKGTSKSKAKSKSKKKKKENKEEESPAEPVKLKSKSKKKKKKSEEPKAKSKKKSKSKKKKKEE